MNRALSSRSLAGLLGPLPRDLLRLPRASSQSSLAAQTASAPAAERGLGLSRPVRSLQSAKYEACPRGLPFESAGPPCCCARVSARTLCALLGPPRSASMRWKVAKPYYARSRITATPARRLSTIAPPPPRVEKAQDKDAGGTVERFPAIFFCVPAFRQCAPPGMARRGGSGSATPYRHQTLRPRPGVMVLLGSTNRQMLQEDRLTKHGKISWTENLLISNGGPSIC